ncbi:MAG: TIGR01212 family radical SAM protein [Desulfobacteraceae bacterium]|nr:TIGR01212 family radical SAM protein [Desulfobacteraceae bacterium]
MKKRYYDLNTYFRKRFGQRVHKLSVDAGLSCPNRDGAIGFGGCIYCNAKGSGTNAHAKGMSITQQLEASKTPVAKRFKAGKFIAYFQSFTNTYAPVAHLKQLYDEALCVPDIAGLAIGTRPDCINEPILELLHDYAKKHLIWIEYGLQSSHDKTLSLINRGHDAGCFVRAVRATAGRGILIGTHVILGLPGESRQDMHATADFIARLPINGVKLHLFYVVRNTPIEALYNQGKYTCMQQREYAEMVCDFLERLPEHIVIQRLTGDPHPRELIAPEWALQKQQTLDLIKQILQKRNTWQGKLFKD